MIMRATRTATLTPTATPSLSSCAATLIASDAIELALRTETSAPVIRALNVALGALSTARSVAYANGRQP